VAGGGFGQALLAQLNPHEQGLVAGEHPTTSQWDHASRWPDRIAKGNVDLYAQPSVKNESGPPSTVDSIGFETETDDGSVVHVLLPQVMPDGRHFSDPDEAWEEYRRTGRHLGTFKTREASDAFGAALSEAYSRGLYTGKGSE
jgi:hypothetical protein